MIGCFVSKSISTPVFGHVRYSLATGSFVVRTCTLTYGSSDYRLGDHLIWPYQDRTNKGSTVTRLIWQVSSEV